MASTPFYLANPTFLVNGALQLPFANAPRATFSVLTATNVTLPASKWTVLGQAVEIAPGQFQFTDPQVTNSSQSFYRVRSP
jgi:hypothetical protein